jgi:hypothetical protein
LRLAAGVIVLCGAQMEFGLVLGVNRLQHFGPDDEHPISVSLLEAIRQLPPDAKLAYACLPFEEVSFGTPRLLALDAHTGRRVVPMCFEADNFSQLLGGPRAVQVPNAAFISAPQRLLYPDAAADPSSTAVSAFMKDHGIEYIYADSAHPNSLVADAVLVARSGDAEVLRLP